MAESTKHLYSLSLFFITFSELLQTVLVWLCTLCFTTRLSTCFNGHHFLDTFSGDSQPADQPTADTDAHPLPTQGATAQPPQLRFFPQRFDPLDGTRTLIRRLALPCTNTPQTCLWPAESCRVTFLVGWLVRLAVKEARKAAGQGSRNRMGTNPIRSNLTWSSSEHSHGTGPGSQEAKSFTG